MEDHKPKVEDIRSTLSHFETYKGLPRCEEIKEWSVKSPQTVIILDDMILLVAAEIDALHIFQIMVPHSNLTAFLLSQNLYPRDLYAKSILPSCQCVNLFMNVRDNRHIW